MSACDTLHIVFEIGGESYVLPAGAVLEMESFAEVTEVPGTPEHVAGLVHIRGRVIPLVDLRTRFGLPPVAPTLDRRIVVVDHDGRRIGFLVDMAREVARIAAETFGPPPENTGERGRRFVKAVAQLGARRVMLLDCERVLEQELADG